MEDEGKEPIKIGEKSDRNEKGQFANGNHIKGNGGRPKGSISLTKLIKEKLQEIPEGQKISYADKIIEMVLALAIGFRDEVTGKFIIEPDSQMIKLIWSYVDGMPKQTIGGDENAPFMVKLMNILNDNGTDSKPEDKG